MDEVQEDIWSFFRCTDTHLYVFSLALALPVGHNKNKTGASGILKHGYVRWTWHECHYLFVVIFSREKENYIWEEGLPHRSQVLNTGKITFYRMSLNVVSHLPYSWKPSIQKQTTLIKHRFGDIFNIFYISKDSGIARTTKTVLLKSIFLYGTSSSVWSSTWGSTSNPLILSIVHKKTLSLMGIYITLDQMT